MALNVTYSTDAILTVVRSKTPSFQKKAVDLTLRNRVAFPLMKKWGNLLLGIDISWARLWNAKNKLPETEEWVDTPDQDFPAGPEQQQFSLDAGDYICKDNFSYQQYERAKGSATQIVNVYKEKAVDCQTSMSNRLNWAFLHGPGTGTHMSGLDTFLGTGTTAKATDIVFKPDDSYAGQVTDVGVEGSWGSTLATPPNASIGSDWPEVPLDGSPEFDWNGPVMLVRNSPLWKSGPEWASNSFELFRYWCGVQKARGAKVADPSAKPVALCGERSEREFKELCDARNYTLAEVPEAVNIGMPMTVYFEGLWVTSDSDIEADHAYMLQPDMMEFYTGPSYPNMWEMKGPYAFDPEFRHLYACTTIGQFRFQPKYHGKIMDSAD